MNGTVKEWGAKAEADYSIATRLREGLLTPLEMPA
jgi:hypothetical protein